jgi:hypothetical protein
MVEVKGGGPGGLVVAGAPAMVLAVVGRGGSVPELRPGRPSTGFRAHAARLTVSAVARRV